MVVRSKICGITRIEDALLAAEAGADAIGLVFYDKSPRAVDVRQARAILAALPPFVTSVGLFVNASRCFIGEVLDAVPLDLLQFHGDETPEQCEGHGRPWFKALDAYVPGVPGGTGERFDWKLIPADLPRPLILAGGLTPDNVAEAIASVRPYGVDVSGGVEASRGIKDAAKVAAFIQRVREAGNGM